MVTDGLPVPRRYWAILTIVIAVAMAVLDGAIANTALPTIARELQASPATAVWVVNAYQLAVIVTLLPFASLGDIFGYKRVYAAGLVVFTLASLACALSWSMPTLIAARVLQGFGGAGIMSINTALVRFVYPRRMLGRGVGYNALVVAISTAIGPTVASAILSVASWQWLFAVNVPLGFVALALAVRMLPRTPRSGHEFDAGSAVLNACALGLLIIGIGGAAHGTSRLVMAAELLGALAFAVALVRRQLRLPAPMLPVDLFRRPIFALSAATAVCSFAAQSLAYVSLPFLFQGPLGRTQVETGLLMTPWPMIVAVMAPIAGRMADRYPVGILGGIGMAVLSAGLLLTATLPAHATTVEIVWRMLVCGAGFGFFQAPNVRALMHGVPAERSGGASGIVSTARLLGQSVGAALVALCFGLAPTHGATLALLLGAGFAGAASVVSFARMVEFGTERVAQ